jgi:hypothetical protein
MTIYTPIESPCQIWAMCVLFESLILCILSKIMKKQDFYAYFCIKIGCNGWSIIYGTNVKISKFQKLKQFKSV